MAVTFDFAGKAAIVTGGSRGIGKAVVRRLARSRCDVWIWDADPVPVDGAHSQTVDVTKVGDIRNALREVIAESGQVDILVNNAGYLGPYCSFGAFEPAEWQRIIGVNLIGTFEVTHQILPVMRKAGSGRIVYMGSLAGKEGLPNLAAYSAASAGIIAFTKALSREVSDSDIRINCVAPGPIDTDLIRRLGNEVVSDMIRASPLKRLGAADEVAALVLWLCSDAVSFNTGAVFDMSGGRARY